MIAKFLAAKALLSIRISPIYATLGEQIEDQSVLTFIHPIGEGFQ